MTIWYRDALFLLPVLTERLVMVWTKPDIPPTQAHLLAPVAQLDFFDFQSCMLSGEVSALEAWNSIRSHPMPILRFAVWIRDVISVRFGVKPIGGFSQTKSEPPKEGEKLDFFLVEHISPHVLTLTARDRHLDVMTCISVDERTVSITSSVITHNTFGRVYMLPVAIAHRLIVRNDLARLSRRHLRET